MATWTTMITVTSDQWLELHRRTQDCVRGAILGLSPARLRWQPASSTGGSEAPGGPEPRMSSIGGVVSHLCEAAMQHLGEVNIRSEYAFPQTADWNVKTFDAILDRIELQYRDALAKWPKDRHILFGLGRVCQHNLHHMASLVQLRRLQEPDWRPAPASQPGSWGYASDYITDLLIHGDKATHTASLGA